MKKLFVVAAVLACSVATTSATSCTSAADCSNHAVSVSGTTQSGCTCTCRNLWSGVKCDSCPAGVDAASDCGACSPGYAGYPACSRVCTVSTDCSNHAVGVSGMAPNCNCMCRNMWTGSKCDVCPAKYGGSDCAECAPGYSGTFPTCTKSGSTACTAAADCSNHAVSVSGTTQSGCTCTCRNLWSGVKCDSCPAGVDAASDCGACSPGYAGYPACSRVCTVSTDCSNHAVGVSGMAPNCNCMCRNMWTGSKCDVCPAKYGGSDCAECAPGYSGTFPTCTKSGSTACTAAADCSNHAVSVSGTTQSGCTCTCRNLWSGVKCDSCPAGVDAASDCGACSPGYAGYPACSRVCTVSTDCSNHAVGVSGMAPNCNCMCRNMWTGSKCDVCPAKYGGSDCAECAPGYSGTFPTCTKSGSTACTAAADCSNHAVSVSGTTQSGCTCTCRNLWSGVKCDSCPAGVDAASDCGACSPGYAGYPACSRVCTVSTDCSNHAVGVSGMAPNCNCMCRNMWTGSKCDVCPAKYGGPDCAQCAPGFGNYPACTKSGNTACTVAADCSNHAIGSSGTSPNCSCTCRNLWSGVKCDSCPAGVDAASDCGACSPGYAGYPACSRVCTVSTDCSNHAVGVSGMAPNCNCMCRNMWTGSKCDVCPAKYGGSDCAECAPGYSGTFPTCTKSGSTACTVAADCSNHAVSVSGTTQSGCTCTCRNLWSGVKCDSCPAGVDAASDCGACSPGYAGYPACSRVCTVSTDCSNHAVGVSGVAPNCNCMCRNMWTGSKCDVCPAKYGGPDCAECAPGYAGPACSRVCTVPTDCSNHAIGVSGTSPNCSCTCRNLWSGVKCDSCPTGVDAASDCGACSPGYAGYPACSKSSATTQPPQTPAPTRDTKPDGKHEQTHSPRAAAEDEEKESTAAKLKSFFSSPLGIAAAVSVVVALLATIVAVLTLLKMKRVVKTQAALPTNFDVMDPAEKSGVYRVMVNEL